MSTKLDSYTEETRGNDHVEILDGPMPFSVNGRVCGTAQIQREEVLDYKTKAPTGEKLVTLVIAPSQGRQVKARLKYAVAALESLGFIPEPPALVTVKKGQKTFEIDPAAVEILADGWKVVTE